MTSGIGSQRSELAAVLFDMDGTLLDSEKLWDIALDELADKLGGELSKTARRRMVGSSVARSVAILHADLGLEADPETSSAFLLARTEKYFHTDLVWKPGALELLHAVHSSGLPASLVTSTHRRLAEIALDTIGRHFFSAIVCGDEVGQPKPHPEPYLKAMALLDVEPSRCVAIEDSPLGIAAAEASGCAVLVIPSEVEIPPADTRTIMPTLAGLGVADLAELVARHRGRSEI
jgi:HAD superfamily hydrolase (TIGR01509 family)